jgi:hypothetical protein
LSLFRNTNINLNSQGLSYPPVDYWGVIMGIFDFLKKDKAETPEAGMELPPVPKIEGMEGFPETKEEGLPPIPDTSLPPLPTEVPGEVPPKPEEKEMAAPKVELPEPPKMEFPAPEKVEVEKPELEAPKPEAAMPMPPLPETPEIPEPPAAEPAPEMPTPEEIKEVMGKEEVAAKPTFPETPPLPSDDIIPDKIPPLEGLPEPPEFKAEQRPQIFESAGEVAPPPAPVAEEMPPAYFPPEEPVMQKRPARGPLFIRSDRFKAIIDDIEQVRASFKSEDDVFLRITDVKNSQDQKFEDFRQSLEDMQRKLLFIDRSLFESTTHS